MSFANSPAACYSFDLDGTIANTRPFVTAAYRAVGISMPPGAWGRDWSTWLPDLVGSFPSARMIHTQKNRIYAELIEANAPELLPPGRIVQRLAALRKDVRVLTSASSAATVAVLTKFGLEHVQAHTALRRTDKIDLLRMSGGFYVDDDWMTIMAADGLDNCTPIYYTEELTEEYLWTQLSLQPVEARD